MGCLDSCCGECKRPVGYQGKETHKRRNYLGHCVCVLWYILFPVVWVWQSIRIYPVACICAYIAGACGLLWLRVGKYCCCCCAKTKCVYHQRWCICFPFLDKNFPHSNQALCNEATKDSGKAAFKSKEHALEGGRGISGGIEWRRIEELFMDEETKLMKGRPCLFDHEIEPSDIDQGGLGDCWLMSAMACLTMSRGTIQNCFLTEEYNRRGEYSIRLYNGKKRRFVTVVVDDYVPVHKGTHDTLFANPHGCELWVLLLEKAFAKLVGSYYGLNGGLEAWALQVMTGDHVHVWKKTAGGKWMENEMRYRDAMDDKELAKKERALKNFEEALALDPSDTGLQATVTKTRAAVEKMKREHASKDLGDLSKGADDVAFFRTDADTDHTSDHIFDSIVHWTKHGAVLTAGAPEGELRGLRGGHAYSVFAAVEVEHKGDKDRKTRLIRLRNPWGQSADDSSTSSLARAGLWNGSWKIGDPQWSDKDSKTNCAIRKAALQQGATEEELNGGPSKGFCWMPYSDFASFFDTLTVCHRSHGIQDLHLDFNEDEGLAGPAKGCVLGCLDYYCCCTGIERLCCEADHSHSDQWTIGDILRTEEEDLQADISQP